MSARGLVVWFTGLPASGKTTLAHRVREELAGRTSCVVLDSDEVRETLGAASYTAGDRDAFYATLGRLAGLIARQGHVVLVAATAPRRAHRDQARAYAPAFIEVWVRTPLALCEARDRKGLYQRAREGGAPTLPGLGVPYEPPRTPDVIAEDGHDDRATSQLGRLVSARVSGARPARDEGMTLIEQLATEADVLRLIGEVDQLTIARILAVAPTADELDEAARSIEDEAGFGEEPRTPSSARVQSIRSILAELAEEEVDREYEPEVQRL